MVLGLYTKGRSSMKFKLPKMPKVKMPDIVGNAKKLGKAVSKEVGGMMTASQVTCKPLACEQPMSTSLTTPTTHLSCMLIAEPRVGCADRSPRNVITNLDPPLRSLGRSRKNQNLVMIDFFFSDDHQRGGILAVPHERCGLDSASRSCGCLPVSVCAQVSDLLE